VGGGAPAKDRTRTCGSKNQKLCSINSIRTLIDFLKYCLAMGWKEGGIVQSGHICCKRELDFGVTKLGLHDLFPNVCSGPVTTIGSLHLL